MEFLISENIGIHPLAIRDYDANRLSNSELSRIIEDKINNYSSATEWYINTLANSICEFASLCPQQTVNIRFPDLLSDDYLTLEGGYLYEDTNESNPMLGWRGTTKLISDEHKDAFVYDCLALKEVVEVRGFKNVNIILPFCRTPEDALKAIKIIQSLNICSPKIGMMVEIPSNVVLGDDFGHLFDFFLVGPMDLTQLTYAADRKSTKLGYYNNETKATKEMVNIFLNKIQNYGKDVYIGGWPLFQYYWEEYRLHKSNNNIIMVELPDRLLELFNNIKDSEKIYKNNDKIITENICVNYIF